MRLRVLYEAIEKGEMIPKLNYKEFVLLANKETGKTVKRTCINGVKQAYLNLRDYYGKI